VRAKDPSSAPRHLTSWGVLVAILVILAGMVGLGVWGVLVQIRSRVVDTTVQGTTILSSLVVERGVTYTDISEGIHPQNRAKLDNDIYLLQERRLLLGLRVWALAGGTLVYSDPEHPDGPPRLAADVLAQARAGHPFAVESSDDEHGAMVLVYRPYDVNGDGQMDAVAEVHLPRRGVDESIARSTRLLYGGAVLALILAVGGILQVRRRQIVQDHAAAHDVLTGLGNRVLLRRRASALIANASVESPASLLVIDLNGFKGVNDSLGHHAGDELLVAVAGAISRACRPGDTPIRLGGDEFAVLLPRTGPGGALLLAEEIRRAMREPVQIAGLTVEIDACAGVAIAPTHARDLSGLLHCADVAMYQGKQTGGGVVVYDPAHDVQTDRNVTLVPELRRAMQDGLLELHYQPLVPAAGPVTEVEALLRWRHPRRGLLDAADFVPAVERTSLLWSLTEWVLAEAATRCARWRADGHDLTVAINISGRTLREPTLPAAVSDAAAAAGLPAHALRLEVAEPHLAGDTDPGPALAALRAVGVSLTVDDAGGAFRALGRLAGAVPDQLKVDPELVGAATGNEMAHHAVSGLIRFAGRVGMAVVAAGVEDEETSRAMTRLGCDAVQGYAACPPMSGDEIAGWLDARAGYPRPRVPDTPEPVHLTSGHGPVIEGHAP
jgi:diguanylate cyclase (GGDEF)-like protein